MKSISTEMSVKYELTNLEESTNAQVLTPECRVYKRRWVVLAIFMLFGIISTVSWMQYAIMAIEIINYYNVSNNVFGLAPMIFVLSYIPLIFPALYLLDKKGLRVSILIGTFGTVIGSCLKAASTSPHCIAVAFTGHTFTGVSQLLLLTLPPKLAAVWFGADQVSTACSLGACGILVGVGLGKLSSLLHPDIEDISNDMPIFNYGMAASSIVLFVLVVLFFQDAPPVPPSVAQRLKQGATKEGFLKPIKRLLVNRGFLLLLISYGFKIGFINSVYMLLSLWEPLYLPDDEELAGLVGIVTTAVSVAAVVVGYILDQTRKYKETTLALYIFPLVGMLVITFVFHTKFGLGSPLTLALFGLYLGCVLPFGFELAMELTYPEPEGTSAGLLVCISMLLGVAFTLVYSHLLDDLGYVWWGSNPIVDVSNLVLCGALLVGTVLTAFIPPDMRRQAATRTRNTPPDPVR